MTQVFTDINTRYTQTLEALLWGVTKQTKLIEDLPGALESSSLDAITRNPRLIIFSGLSGSGKTTTINYFKNAGYKKLRTITTRPMRPGETSADAFFVNEEEFLRWEREGFVFYPHERNGALQGVYVPDLNAITEGSGHFYTDRSVASAKRLLQKLGTKNIQCIYILPPTLEILLERIHTREKTLGHGEHTLNDEAILMRLDEEIEDMQLLHDLPYCYIKNDKQERVVTILKKYFPSKSP